MQGWWRWGISLTQASQGQDNKDGYQQYDSEHCKPSPVFGVPSKHGGS
jgi:hypothetical protein